jgi:hypothetical protein
MPSRCYLKSNNDFFPLEIPVTDNSGNIAYLAVGINSDNTITKRMRNEYNASVFYYDNNNKDNKCYKKTVRQHCVEL